MGDEDWRKRSEEIDREWDGPISVSPAHFLSLFPDSEESPPPPTPAARRVSAMSKLGIWIAKKLAFGQSSDIRHS